MRRIVSVLLLAIAMMASSVLIAGPAYAWGTYSYTTAPWDCDAYFASSPTSYGAAANTQRQSGNQCSPMFVRWRFSNGQVGIWVQAQDRVVITSTSSSGKSGANHKICNGCTVFST